MPGIRVRPPLSLCCILLTLCAGGCTQFDALNATIPSCDYTCSSDIAYGSQPRQKLDVYVPRHASPHASVVVFFYGGSWQNGSKRDYRFVAEALASRGFIAVLPDYRLYPDATFPAFVYDGAGAVKWVQSNINRFGGDAHAMYLMGHSAGAHIAALLTLDPRYLASVGLDSRAIRATVGLAGPYDFVPQGKDRLVFSMRPDQPPDPAMEPITFANHRAPPMLLIQGRGDTTVNPNNASKLAARLQQSGSDLQIRYYPDVGHVRLILSFAFPFRFLTTALDDVTTYIHEKDSRAAQ